MPVERKPCVPCRYKKVKCDRVSPECGSCRRGLRKFECTYDESDYIKPKLQSRISKGQACIPCRRKKKKCDGKRPHCSICLHVGAEMECAYLQETESPHRVPGPSKLRNIKPVSYVSHSKPSESVIAGTSSMSYSTLRHDTESLVTSQWIRNVFHQMKESDGRLDLTFDLNLPAQLRFCYNPIIRIPFLSISDPRASALSKVSLEDMNMTLLAFVDYRHHIGVFLPSAKKQAIILGDLSHKIVHPFFIRLATSLGCRLYQEREQNWIHLHTLAINTQLTWEELLRIREEEDPFQYAQAYHLVCCTLRYFGLTGPAKRYWRKSAEVVKRHRIGFVTIVGNDVTWQDLEYSDEQCEKMVLLGNLLYVETLSNLLAGEEEYLFPDLERQLRYELSREHPQIYCTCPVILRVRSILSFKDTNDVLISQNVSTCDTILSSLTVLLNELSGAFDIRAKMLDTEGCTSIRYSTIICLVALAELFHFLENSTGSDLSMYYQLKCENALDRMVRMAKSLDEDNLSLRDPFVGFFWARAIAIILDRQSALAISSASSRLTSIMAKQKFETNVQMIAQLKESLEFHYKRRASPTKLYGEMAKVYYATRPEAPKYMLDDFRVAVGI